MIEPSKIVLIVIGIALMITSIAKATPPSAAEVCTANDKLFDIVKDLENKMAVMIVEDKKELEAAKKETVAAKKEADEVKKKYEELLAVVRSDACTEQRLCK